MSSLNPIQFIQEVRQEVAKVTWPTWKEVWITTIMVLFMVTLASAFFTTVDLVLGQLIQLVLGIGKDLPGLRSGLGGHGRDATCQPARAG